MIGDTVTVTYDSVDKTLTKINQDNYGAVYFLDDGTERYTMNVKHTIPARGKAGESHLVRLDVEHYDTDAVLLRTASAWTVIRTDVGIQDATNSEDVTLALGSFLDSSTVAKIVGRQS